jgi:hypothetical protein
MGEGGNAKQDQSVWQDEGPECPPGLTQKLGISLTLEHDF